MKGGTKFLSDEWRAYFRFALQEVKRLNMRASLNFCDGWCSGGPWIKAEQANKKLVFQELRVEGGKIITQKIPHPEVIGGYYKEIAVLAFRVKSNAPLKPAEVTASSSAFGYVWEVNHPPEAAADGDPDTFWQADSAAPAWLNFRYNEQLAATAINIVPTAENGPRDCELQLVSGNSFTTICKFTLEKGQAKQVSFPGITGGGFRLLINSAYGKPVEVANVEILRDGDKSAIKPRIEWWDFKSGKRSFWDWPKQGPIALTEEYTGPGIAPDCLSGEILDITSSMNSEGALSWDAPAGSWNVIRYGYTILGQKMRTANDGYEADMLSPEGIELQFKNIAEPVLQDIADSGTGDIFDCFSIDSYEIGADVKGLQPNWSATFRDEFKTRRGYDMLKYMPALSYHVVDSREITDRFLWDVRRTIGDLFAERFWKVFRDLSHARGVQIQMETGYGSYPYPHIDSLQCAGLSDIPMGEFWYDNNIMSQFDPWGHVIRIQAAAAHTYGHKLVGAESFTSYTEWASPAQLKPLGDEAYCAGLNRMVLQQYSHQPDLKAKPGNQFAAGTHFDCNLTWWKQSGEFFNYLGRCQHLLQAGLFVADVVYYYGESSTNFVPGKQYLNPPLAMGYDCDTIDTEVLLNRITVKNNRLTLPDGLSYHLMIIRADAVMSVKTLTHIRQLIIEGATVIGAKPQKAPGLSNYPACDNELTTLANEIWADCDGEHLKGKKIGKGRIICGKTPGEVLLSDGVKQDFEYTGVQPGAFIDFIHRSTHYAEIFFVANRNDRPEKLNCTFRVTGRQPEIWDPVAVKMRKAAAYREVEGRTELPLDFAANQSFFIIFRKPGKFVNIKNEGSSKQNFPQLNPIQELNGPWAVHFDPEWGGPASIEFTKLVDWITRPEEGIKYYSGTAIYKKIFDVNKGNIGVSQLFIDLGVVKDVAEVRLNGKNLGIIWTSPWQVEVSNIIKKTGNVLEVTIVNQWPNRVIGDDLLPKNEKHYTQTNVTMFVKNKPLQPSGLLGPVTILEAT
jgi:hypothetical protein